MSILITHCSDCIHNDGVDGSTINCKSQGKIKLTELEKWPTCAAQHWFDDSPNKKLAEDRLYNHTHG
jgi:hypothetical protein